MKQIYLESIEKKAKNQNESDDVLVQEINSVKKVFSWIKNNARFIFVLGSKIEELEIRKAEYERNKSKRNFMKRLKTPLTILGIMIIFIIVSLAVFGSWIAPFTHKDASILHKLNELLPPSSEHLLGTDRFGQDVLSRMIYGARSSLTIALPSIIISTLIGIILGVICAYYRGWIDTIMMRIADVFLAFPALILAMVFVSIGGARLDVIMLAYGILGIPFYTRLIRGSVLQARELPYIQSAKASGSSNLRIMFKHILPNTIQPVIISFTFNIGGVILSFAGLAFLGFTDQSLIEWGNDIFQNRGDLYIAPWASLFPGLMIVLTVLGFMLLGDGLRDALDPKMKNL